MNQQVGTDTLYCIDAELGFARNKFPKNDDLMTALTEEVGGLAKALLHHKHEKGAAKDVFAEAIQVAVMAIRLAEEGSAEFPYKYRHAHYQAFNVNKVLPRKKVVLEVE